MVIQGDTYLSMSERKAVSNEYGISSLYVFWPRKSTPSSMSSQMMRRRISPRYRPEMSFSNACSPGLLEVSSMIWSYLVRGRFSCSNESKAPWKRMCSA